MHTDHLTAEHATVTEKLCANDLRAPKACLGDLTVQNVCSNGVIKGADIQPCAKYVATAVFKADTTYTLGDFVNFDTFIDDPNGNLSSFPNFHYTAPLTGYYMLTVEIDSNNLQGANPVLGIPIANLELTLNGAIGRQSFLPYLGFNNTQNSLISSLVHLTVGDQVGVKYNVGVIDPVTGFSNYVGTIDIKGNGTPVNESLFRIIYLASTCVDLPCQGCDFTCESRHDEPCPKLDCNPCCHRD
ncbi:MAG: hypothetical protein P4L31_08545 [Candidatus Babeliales bacterium]|nr:hypothetical protein [Candidatus Babeliales bacterium]